MKRFLKIKHFVVLLPLITLVITNLRSLDFGDHWDEETWQIKPIQKMLDSGTFLPFSYLYPSLCYWIGLKSTAPEFISLWSQGKTGVKKEVIERVGKKPFLLRLRATYCLLGSLSLLFLYFAVYEKKQKVWPAFIAASLLGLSWEIAYHLRWIATDTLLVLCASIVLFFVLKAKKSNSALIFAAIACGFATGSKYPGALLFIVVILKSITLKEPIKRIGLYFLIMVVTFVVTTPGSLIEPVKFLNCVNDIRAHYGSRPHWGYNIASGISYFLKIGEYLALYLLSPFRIVSLFFFLITLLGIAAVFRNDKKEFLVLFSFPFLYILYFSTQSVFIIRNFLVLTPFLVWFCVEGILAIQNKTPKKMFFAWVTVLLIGNGFWLIFTSETVRNHSWPQTLWETKQFLQKNRNQKIFVSRKLRNDLGMGVSSFPQTESDFSLVVPSEVPQHEFWPANLRGSVTKTLGPQEINFNYYPSWPNDRVVLISRSQLIEINKEIPIIEYLKK
jgi:hypothetical protein